MVELSVHGGAVYAWWSCLCMVELSVHGGAVYAWWSCLCMVELSMHGGAVYAWLYMRDKNFLLYNMRKKEGKL